MVSSLSCELRPTKCSFLGNSTRKWDKGVAGYIYSPYKQWPKFVELFALCFAWNILLHSASQRKRCRLGVAKAAKERPTVWPESRALRARLLFDHIRVASVSGKSHLLLSISYFQNNIEDIQLRVEQCRILQSSRDDSVI